MSDRIAELRALLASGGASPRAIATVLVALPALLDVAEAAGRLDGHSGLCAMIRSDYDKDCDCGYSALSDALRKLRGEP